MISLELQRPKVLWRQVAEQMRKKIITGEILPGTKLPATSEMATQSGTDVRTVHRALTELVKEGLITRARKIGTYVCERKKDISPIGIYFSEKPERQRGFIQALNKELQELCHERNIATRVWYDQREDQSTVLPEIEQALHDHSINALIATAADSRHSKWLARLPIPLATLGGSFDSSVHLDLNQFFEKSIRILREKGITKIGFITALRGDHPALKGVASFARSEGVEVKDEWVFRPTEFLRNDYYEFFGFDCFQQLWSQAERPEGLIVYPDEMARGVVMGVMNTQAKVPEELQVVFHKNMEIDYFCHLPVTYVATCVRDVAEAHLKQVMDCFEGIETKPIAVPHRVIHVAEPTNEAHPWVVDHKGGLAGKYAESE